MSFGIDEFEEFLALDHKEKAKKDEFDASQHRVLEKLTSVQLVIRHGQRSPRSVISQRFPLEEPAHIIYGDTLTDLFLTDVLCLTDNWVIDTQGGAHVHMHCGDIRKGLPGSRKRKIDVKGSGILVLHFTEQELENAYMLEKGNIIFIMPLYTSGFIIRGNIKFACTDPNGEVKEIPLRQFFAVKHERVVALAHSPIAQKQLQPLKTAEKIGLILEKQQMQLPEPPKAIGQTSGKSKTTKKKPTSSAKR
jgi:hypothetical protein